MENTKTIIFDAGGVLFTAPIPKNRRISNILKAKGYEEAVISKGLLIGDQYWTDLYSSDKWLYTWEDEEKAWHQYFDIVLCEIDNNSSYSLKRQLFHQTHYTMHCELYNEVIEVLEALSENYKLGVISNAHPSMEWVFDRLDIRKFFDDITLSAFVGKPKPCREIYQVSLEALGNNPEECLFIDNQQRNIDGAKELGIKGIYLDREVDDLSVVYRYLNDSHKLI